MPKPPDPKRPEAMADLRDFGGLVLKLDPHDLAKGTAVEQVNAASSVPGELRPRGGARAVKFD